MNSGVTIEALETQGILEVLAEPNIVAMDGQEASFLAGGEYPYPMVQGTTSRSPGAVTIEFKEYGVRLNFIPTVMPRGNIRLQVAPEVSALDFRDAVQISGFNVPAITTRKMKTEVELSEGSDLCDWRTARQSRKRDLREDPFHWRYSDSGQVLSVEDRRTKTNTELIVLVTPEIVAPSRRAPRHLCLEVSFEVPAAEFEYSDESARCEDGCQHAGSWPATIPVETLLAEHEAGEAAGD